MSKRPQNPPPPRRPGAARRGGTAAPHKGPYKRPVQSPDAETVMLPSYEHADPAGTREPGPAAHAAAPDVPAEDEPAASTRVLVLPRGRRGPDLARLAESSARRTWVSRAALAAILCVQAALSLRMNNTAFNDEALYLYAGHMEIAHLLHGAPLQGSYATYFPGAPVLYPVLAAAADSIGGLAAARAVSLIAMLCTTALLYGMSRRLFNERVGLCAAALFAVTEGTIFLGRLATNDAVSLSLLALASWIVIRTASWRWRAYLLAAPVAALAAATDYWALLYLPTIAILAGLAAHPFQGRQALARSLLLWAITVELLAGAVVVAGQQYAAAVLTTTVTRSAGSTQALSILAHGGTWGGLVMVVAVLGAVGYALRARTEPNEHIALPGSRRRRAALGITLAGTALLTLAYQLYLNTSVSLDRHIAFGLFFAAPMAGVGLARLVGDHFRRAQVGIVVWAAALMLGLAQAGQLFGSWPDSTALVGELTHYLRPGAHYLVEDDDVPIYYLIGHPDAQPDQFTSTYYISYRTGGGQVLTGTQGFLAAVRAGYFRVVIYDDTVTPALDKSLAATLRSDPGYRFVAAVPENAPDFRTTCYVWVRS
jgi:hypothetical protein